MGKSKFSLRVQKSLYLRREICYRSYTKSKQSSNLMDSFCQTKLHKSLRQDTSCRKQWQTLNVAGFQTPNILVFITGNKMESDFLI